MGEGMWQERVERGKRIITQGGLDGNLSKQMGGEVDYRELRGGKRNEKGKTEGEGGRRRWQFV